MIQNSELELQEKLYLNFEINKKWKNIVLSFFSEVNQIHEISLSFS